MHESFFIKVLRFSATDKNIRRLSLAVFIVEQVALNRHAFGFQVPVFTGNYPATTSVTHIIMRQHLGLIWIMFFIGRKSLQTFIKLHIKSKGVNRKSSEFQL